MLILLPSLLAATLISCIPFSDDLNDIQDDQTWNVDSIDSSNIAFEKDEETETGLNDIAQACSSSPDTNGILRRASMCKPTGIVGPEEPSEGVTLQPKLSSDFKLKTPSDRECVNFPQRPHYVTCGGPEVYSRSDQFRDSTLVYNCFAGFNDKFAARGWFEATTKFARYCCAEFTDQYPDYVAEVCAKLSPYPRLPRMSVEFWDQWVKRKQKEHPAYPPADAKFLQRVMHFFNTPL